MHIRGGFRRTFYESAKVAIKSRARSLSEVQQLEGVDILEEKCKDKTIANKVTLIKTSGECHLPEPGLRYQLTPCKE